LLLATLNQNIGEIKSVSNHKILYNQITKNMLVMYEVVRASIASSKIDAKKLLIFSNTSPNNKASIFLFPTHHIAITPTSMIHTTKPHI